MSFRNSVPCSEETKSMLINNDFKPRCIKDQKSSEECLIYLQASLCLVNKEFPEFNVNNMSENFLGNFWRFKALYELSQNTEGSNLSQGSFFTIEKYLKTAEEKYQEIESDWGLGLTYNLHGRIQSLKEKSFGDKTFETAKDYFQKSIDAFSKIDHYRGIQTTMQDFNDLQMKHMEVLTE